MTKMIWMEEKNSAPQGILINLAKCAARGDNYFRNLARKQKSLATLALE